MRCKFERSIQSQPISVLALGLDEFFMSTTPCFTQSDSNDSIECTCLNKSCPRKIISKVNDLAGLDGIRSLCHLMPSFMRLAKESYPAQANYLDGLASQQYFMTEQEVHDTIRRLGVLMDVLASSRPVLFFVDDVSGNMTYSPLVFLFLHLIGSLLFFHPAAMGRHHNNGATFVTYFHSWNCD